MSKAFTKESDEGVDETLPDRPSVLPPGTPNYVTPRGARAARRELDALLAERGAEPAVRRERDRRARALQRLLETAEIVPGPIEAPTLVRFGLAVRVEDAEARTHTYEIVGVDEADVSRGRLSWWSPMARALVGHAVGETVTFRSPRGDEELTVLAVERVPDDPDA